MLQTRIKNRLIRRGIVALALLATLSGAPVAAGQTFDEAVAAYDRGDYATAVRGFLVHAEQGDATAQYKLGVMYNYGWGVPEDEGRSCALVPAGCRAGLRPCAAQPRCHVHQWARAFSRDEAEAVRWYRLAADQGNAGAQLNLGFMYASGEGVLKDEAEAVRWYRLAADQGNARAQSNLGVMYASGEGVLKDEAEAVRWYRLAADQGNARAQFNLGFMYAKRRGRSQGRGRSRALVPARCRAGPRQRPGQPRGHAR